MVTGVTSLPSTGSCFLIFEMWMMPGRQGCWEMEPSGNTMSRHPVAGAEALLPAVGALGLGFSHSHSISRGSLAVPIGHPGQVSTACEEGVCESQGEGPPPFLARCPWVGHGSWVTLGTLELGAREVQRAWHLDSEGRGHWSSLGRQHRTEELGAPSPWRSRAAAEPEDTTQNVTAPPVTRGRERHQMQC